MRKGIHPLLHNVTIVMRNGASYKLSTVFKKRMPFFLQQARQTAQLSSV